MIATLLLGSLELSAQESSWPQNYNDQSAQDGTYDQYDRQPQASYALNTRQPLNAGQLEQLVAPIALYPDALVAQVLAAATYPQQVAEADRWRESQSYASAEEIVSIADRQPWDPSMKALMAFPQVLAEMDRNLQWTTDLGNAYYNQPQDVLEAVQVMRQRAQAAGTLQSTPQEVVRYDGANIQLVPVDPQVVYVPTYNPWAVYGEPVAPYPGFSLFGVIGNALGAILHYGPGIAMSAFARTPWGWLAWGLDWLGHALLFHDSAYYSHSTTVADWGFPHRGFYAYSGRGLDRGRHEFAHGWGNSGWGNESWRHENPHGVWHNGRYDSGGWHDFGRGSERRIENDQHANNWNRSNSRGFSGRSPENRAESRYAMNGTRGTERSFAHNFARNDLGARSSGFSSHTFSSHTSAKSHGGGVHLFGASHSDKSFGGRSSEHFHGSVHPPKGFGGGKSFAKNFGGGKSHGGKSFGGGHSHGGGHSSGHSGGGKHHR